MGRFGTFMGKVKLPLNFTKRPQRKKGKLRRIKGKLKNGAYVFVGDSKQMEWFNIAP